MDLTQKYKLSDDLQEIANGSEHSLVTIQNQSTCIMEMTLDERTQEQRLLDKDDIYYRIFPGKERTFKLSALAKIHAKKIQTDKELIIVVIKS